MDKMSNLFQAVETFFRALQSRPEAIFHELLAEIAAAYVVTPDQLITAMINLED